jgi:hypothetical protein
MPAVAADGGHAAGGEVDVEQPSWPNRRMRRSALRETRLATMVATAPLAKRRRALAMSSCGLATGAPTASTADDLAVDQAQDEIDVVDHQGRG